MTTMNFMKKDRGGRHAFKGRVLVNALMEHDTERFPKRAAAIRFAQRLLDVGQIESVVGASIFDDTVHLYRWADDTVVRDAKRIVATSASHIPRKRLIQLLDYRQVDDSDDFFDMRDVQDQLLTKSDNSDTVADLRDDRPHRRQSRDHSLYSSESTGSLNTKPVQQSDLNRVISLSSDRISLLDRDLSRRLAKSQSPPRNARSQSPSSRRNETLSASYPGNCTELSRDTKPVRDDVIDTPVDDVTSDILTTCVYDGVEMPALDLENIDFSTIHSSTMTDSFAATLRSNMVLDTDVDEGIDKTLEGLNELSCSDNEKQLLEEMKRMEDEHSCVVKSYEDRISELVTYIKDLKQMADLLEKKQNLQMEDTEKQPKAESLTSDVTPESNSKTDSEKEAALEDAGVTAITTPQTVEEGKPAAPPPPPPPPPPLNVAPPKLVQPGKPPVKPRVKMRPLFWNRIILDNCAKANETTVWHNTTEPNFDVDEFERFFGRSAENEKPESKCLREAISTKLNKSKTQVVKLLDETRSRAVAIKLRSLHCHIDDVRRALYHLDFNKLDLDNLNGLYETRGTKEELAKIADHVRENPDGWSSLDHPEQFLHELSQMSHFEERLQCLMLRKRFNETLFNIDQQLNIVARTCDEIETNESVTRVLELTLAFGNYMNGGTQRGQADGFQLAFLPKLKDVKSMDNSLSLLQYIVRVHCREHEDDAGKKEAQFPLPDASLMQQASAMSCAELNGELTNLQQQLKTQAKKAKLVYLETEPEYLHPFKDTMEDFFDTADDMLRRQRDKFQITKHRFGQLLKYLSVNDSSDETTVESFFSGWARFIEDYRKCWKVEQKRIARIMFEKVEQKRKERIRSAKRRHSIVCEGKSTNLKQKFQQMRRQNEHQTHTMTMLRSQSVNCLDHTNDSSDILRDKPHTATLKPDIVQENTGVRLRSFPTSRRRRPQSEIIENVTIPVDPSVKSPSVDDSDVFRTESTITESMAERMRRRRRARLEQDEHASSRVKTERELHPIHERVFRRRSRTIQPQDLPQDSAQAQTSDSTTSSRSEIWRKRLQNDEIETDMTSESNTTVELPSRRRSCVDGKDLERSIRMNQLRYRLSSDDKCNNLTGQNSGQSTESSGRSVCSKATSSKARQSPTELGIKQSQNHRVLREQCPLPNAVPVATPDAALWRSKSTTDCLTVAQTSALAQKYIDTVKRHKPKYIHSDKEALSQRDYRDILKKLALSRTGPVGVGAGK